MSDAMSIALTGMNASAMRATSAASNIANALSTTKEGAPSPATEVVQTAQPEGGVSASTVTQSSSSSVDIAAEVVKLQEASQSYQADAKVVTVTDKNQKRLLDTVA